MVQIIEEQPSFGQIMARQLGGLGGEIASKGLDFAAQMHQRQREKQALKGMGFEGIANLPPQERLEFIKQIAKGEAKQKLLESVFPKKRPTFQDRLAEKATERTFEPSEFTEEGGLDVSQMSPDDMIKLGLVDPSLANIAQREQKMKQQERLQKESMEFQREKLAEPKLQEIEDKLDSYEMSGMRFDRLNELFKPELESKFPPSVMVGLFTKDGELRPSVAATLSPDAQEAVKLVSDELTGAKNTFGARVTNFDLQAYMKRLPTLLNTAEGRRRVLRDLQLMNRLNVLREKGILDIIEREGGPKKISVSGAERKFRKENADKIKNLRMQFTNPEKFESDNIEDFDPKLYNGRQIEDPETGRKFISNGKEWVPVG